jgi:hypothetical protein
VPARMKRHWRRESAARRRGPSKQSQVRNNSCASVAATVKPSKASLRALHGESTCEDGNRRSTERERNRNLSINGPYPTLPAVWPTTASRSQPWPAAAGHGQPRPAAAGHGQPRPAAAGHGQPRPAAAGHGGHGQPWLALASRGGLWPAMAASGQPWPAAASHGQHMLATEG